MKKAFRILGIARIGPRIVFAGAAVAALVVACGVAGIIGGADAAAHERFPVFRALYERFMPFLPPRL